MPHRITCAMVSVALLVSCAPASPDAEPGDVEPRGAPAPAVVEGLDLFVDQPMAEAQLVFVAQQRPDRAAEWPHAAFIPAATFSVERDGIPNEFPPPDSLAARLEAAGVRGDRVVIVGEPIPAGRAWAAFDYLGLADRAVLLDGGLPALGAAPTPDEPRAAPATSRLDVSVRDDMIVDAAWVHDRLNDPNTVILDARPPAEFTGETPGDDVPRPGHIPGARNLFWQTLVLSPENPRLRDEAELRRLFEQAGVAPGRTIVAYCRTGGQSSFLYAVARHLGYDVRLYDGSFVDWSRTSYPVELSSPVPGP